MKISTNALLFLFSTILFTLTTCQPEEVSPFISSEDPEGIPFLRGDGHVEADGGMMNDARNIVVSLFIINDDTWGAAGLNSETPIVIRATWTQQLIVSQVIAATKKGGMLDRFRKADGTFGVPGYKLNDSDLDCLYKNHMELDRFRATAAVTAMKRWIEYSFPKKHWGSASYAAREDFYEQLKCTGSECRTHSLFNMFELVDSYTIHYDEYDEESFCTSVSPQEIGEMVATQVNDYFCIDGWNGCGNSNGSGMGSYGPQAYSDSTGYYPVHDKNNSHRWKPIRETDGRGYFTRQEFVVPHIGATADTVYLSAKDREEIREQFTMKPYNNYEELARGALARTSLIAGDERNKTMIAWFDDKLNLAGNTFNLFCYLQGLYWKLEDAAYYLQGYIMLEYDAVVVNWRSKVENDHVRPTTVVQDYLAGEMTNNWRRGINGTETYPAEQWTPYIRVMPHGEYPSGSSCICTVVMKWSAQALRVGYDDDFAIIYNHPAGSNKFEPSLPTEDYESKFRSHKEVADKCAQSRVDGGMHFPDAILAGDQMCGGNLVFDKGVAFQKFIWTGNHGFLEPFGGVEAFGHSAPKDCNYNPHPEMKKEKKKKVKKEKNGRRRTTKKMEPSKFECN